jgi:uncharacterized protein (DUF1778 family)
MESVARKPRKETNVMLRTTQMKKARWKRAGKARGENLSEFMARAADYRADTTADNPTKKY